VEGWGYETRGDWLRRLPLDELASAELSAEAGRVAADFGELASAELSVEASRAVPVPMVSVFSIQFPELLTDH
jgi:hypothetical protein